MFALFGLFLLIKGKKAKQDEGGEKAEAEESTGDEDETNENNSNLMKVPLLSSSQPKYDKNSINLRRIEEETNRQSQLSSLAKSSSLSKSKKNTNVNNPGCSSKTAKSIPAAPGFTCTSSYADFESRKATKPRPLKSADRSMSETAANNTIAARNAVIQEKSKANSNAVRRAERKASKQSLRNVRQISLKRTDSPSYSMRASHARQLLIEGKAKYGHCTNSANETNPDRSTISSTKRVQSASPLSPEKSVYSTPSSVLYPVKHADSWYTSNWDNTDAGGSTITSTTELRTHATETSYPLSSNISGSVSTRTIKEGDSWHTLDRTDRF